MILLKQEDLESECCHSALWKCTLMTWETKIALRTVKESLQDSFMQSWAPWKKNAFEFKLLFVLEHVSLSAFSGDLEMSSPLEANLSSVSTPKGLPTLWSAWGYWWPYTKIMIWKSVKKINTHTHVTLTD